MASFIKRQRMPVYRVQGVFPAEIRGKDDQLYALEIHPETPVSERKNPSNPKLVYDEAALPSKPNRVCCNKKYGSRIQEIQRSARKPFCAAFWASVGVNTACITGSLVFMAGFCSR